MGPSIKYVTLLLANFYPLLCHTLSHIPGPPPKVRHTSGTPRFLVGLVQKTQTKTPCTNSHSIVRGGFCPGGFVRGSFVWKVLSGVGFVHSPFCQNTCYNRKSNITLNFMFHMYDKKCINVTSHALYPSPVTNCHIFSDPPPPSSVTYFMDGPIAQILKNTKLEI